MRARGAGASPVQSLHPAFPITHKVGFPAIYFGSPCFGIFWPPEGRAPLLAETLKYDSKRTKTTILTQTKFSGDGTPSRGGLWPLDLPARF